MVKRKKAPAEMNRGSLFALVSARSVAGLMSMIIRNFPISVNRDFVRSAQQQAKQRAWRFAGSPATVGQALPEQGSGLISFAEAQAS
ncbi:hypothetical protein [Aminobacter ciceronei]|uniref:hypothetical protein n=1 Tax=Aminobacter ciceronei TaxID=150723 RepID=UPI003F6F158E